jgi:hypothetical protein
MFSNLQQNKNIIIDSFPNEVAPGKLNSLKRITQSQNICLNSCLNYLSLGCCFLYSSNSTVKDFSFLRSSFRPSAHTV